MNEKQLKEAARRFAASFESVTYNQALEHLSRFFYNRSWSEAKKLHLDSDSPKEGIPDSNVLFHAQRDQETIEKPDPPQGESTRRETPSKDLLQDFSVEWTKTYTQSGSVRVQAKTRQQAELIALGMIGDLDSSLRYQSDLDSASAQPTGSFVFSEPLKVPEVWQELLDIESLDELDPPVLARMDNPNYDELLDANGHTTKAAHPQPLKDDYREVRTSENGHVYGMRLYSGRSNYRTEPFVILPGDNTISPPEGSNDIFETEEVHCPEGRIYAFKTEVV